MIHQEMENNFIHSFVVKGLWGYKDYPINLNEDVNVIRAC